MSGDRMPGEDAWGHSPRLKRQPHDALSLGFLLIADPSVSYVEGESTATLSYAPLPNRSGSATITVTVTDAGADQIFGSGDEATVARDFLVNVLATNDPPTFFFSDGSVSVAEDSGRQTIDNFIVGISPGGLPDESGQQLLDFVITTDDVSSRSRRPRSCLGTDCWECLN